MTELCGHMTKTGQPCNMPKGHHAPYHRYREYNKPMSWVVRDSNGKLLRKGKGRIELGYVITEFMRKGVSIVIDAIPGAGSAQESEGRS